MSARPASISSDHFPGTMILKPKEFLTGKKVNWSSPAFQKPFRCPIQDGDLTILNQQRCPAGGPSRMLRVTGRSDDMLIIRGECISSQVESVLSVLEVEPHYMIVVDRKGP